MGERRVWRLCRQQRVWSTTTKKGRRGAGKTPGPAVHDDLVQRVFTAPAPDVVLLTDITEHPTLEGKLYCCAVKDVFSNRIVGYAIDNRMTARLACSALRSAIARRQPEGTAVDPIPIASAAWATGHTASMRCHLNRRPCGSAGRYGAPEASVGEWVR